MEAADLERWDCVQRVFDYAMDLSPARRATYLDRACGRNGALREEVEALLDAGARAGSFLEAPPGGFAWALMEELGQEDAPGRDLVGSRVGPYRILELVGSGGMGAVYLAEREGPHKRVALKLIHAGMGTGDVRRRFLNEREILAALEHPAIAQLFDGGMTAEGAPYFVMEYVDGLPIDRYCDEHCLPIPDRLALFRDVCRAVAYAHQHLVVHRDLKPSNILVAEDEDGRPGVKLLDFGIAKVLRPDRVPRSVDALTRTQARLMTPEYASPEQVRGANVTTASDVYALGVLLYELLTGHRPYRSRSPLPHELARAVLEEDPVRPSTAVMRTEEVTGEQGDVETITPADVGQARSTSAERLRRRLRGDLDNVVMKALRKEKERRYASAEQLAEDVRRYLEGLPVKARKGTVAYRAGKFVRRHRWGVVVALAFVLLLAGYAATATSQAREIAQERDRAERAAREARREARKAERVTEFVVSVFEVADPGGPRGGRVTAQELLERGVQRVGEELGEEPEVEAKLMEVIGRVYRSLSMYEEATPLLEQALAQRRRLYSGDHASIASSLYHLAMLLQRKGRYGEAEPLYREALSMRQRLYGEGAHPDVAESLHGLARLLHRKGRYDEAERLYREALRQRQALYGDDDLSVAASLSGLGLLLRYKGAYDEAEPLLRRGLAISRNLLGPEHPDVTSAVGNLALLLRNRGAYDEAEALLRETLALRQRASGEDHAYAAIGLHDLARLLHIKGDHPEAETLYRRALALRSAHQGTSHTATALTMIRLADLLAETSAPAEADSLYRRALGTLRRVYPDEHPRMALAHMGLGQLRFRQGRPGEAEEPLREGLRICREKLPEGHEQIAVAESLLGQGLAALGRPTEAGPLLVGGHAALEAKLGADHWETRRALARVEAFRNAEGGPVQALSSADVK